MRINTMKNITIVILIAVSVIQTGKLWLGERHNFFYSLFAQTGVNYSSNTYEGIYLVKPARIAGNFGNGKFSILYTNSFNNQLEDKANEAIGQIIRNGEFVNSKALSYTEILNMKSVIFEYNFNMPAEAFAQSFNEKGQNFTNKIKEFDKIVIAPTRNTTEQLRAMFINTSNNTVYTFKLPKNTPLSAAILNELDTLQNDSSYMTYISTYQKSFTIFKDNIFIPQFPQGVSYHPIIQKSPYVQSLEDYIYPFFSGAIRYSGIGPNNVYIYSDESTVVKYNPKGVLEYYNYESSADRVLGLVEAYAEAREFIKKDLVLKNDLFLTDVIFDANEWQFYFDYSINNYPIIISEQIKEELGLESGLSITVGENGVRNYKRYAFDFSLETSLKETIDVDFLEALNTILAKNPMYKGDGVISDLFLGYEVGQEEDTCLNWFIEANGQIVKEKTNK